MFTTYLRLGLHVSASSCSVIRATRKLIRKDKLRDRASRSARHRIYSQMLTYHRKAQETYRAAMTGDFA